MKITSVGIEVTQKCNLSCAYCYLGDRDSESDMNCVVADKVIDFLNKVLDICQPCSITFWGGEPLLNFDIIKYIVNSYKAKEKKHDNVCWSIITNGTIMNCDILDFCYSHDIVLQISLDGNKDNHDKLRKFRSGNGSYDKVMTNISKIKMKEALVNKNLFHIKGTFTTSSIPVVSNMIDFYEYENLEYSVTPITPSPKIENKNRISLANVECQAKEICNNWFYLYSNEVIAKNNLIINLLRTIIKSHKSSYACSAGVKLFAIGFDGKIYPCHRSFNNLKSAIGDVFNGIDYRRNILKYYGAKNNEKEICKKCAFLNICPGICPGETAAHLDNQYVDYVYCVYYKTLIKECFINLLSFRGNKLNVLYEKLIVSNDGEYSSDLHRVIFKQIVCMLNEKNILNDDVLIKDNSSLSIDLGDDGIIYLENKPARYIGNITVMAIWDLLDGKRTVCEIIDTIANICDVPTEDIQQDVCDKILTLLELGFIKHKFAKAYNV